jgi:hypothetical protein
MRNLRIGGDRARSVAGLAALRAAREVKQIRLKIAQLDREPRSTYSTIPSSNK